jgi:hypothetical protein
VVADAQLLDFSDPLGFLAVEFQLHPALVPDMPGESAEDADKKTDDVFHLRFDYGMVDPVINALIELGA